MKLTKKLNIALLLVLVCLVLVIGASYAWLTIALNPEVQRIETNVGANGSLEIALLTEDTFEDPTRITTSVGDSAARQDVQESNKSWGNVIQLGGGYGMEEITLLPARLNVTRDEEGTLRVDNSMFKTAQFGIDGRIRILEDDTVSAIWDYAGSRDDFTYYVDSQRYGVRAIGTISNLSAQQIALSQARTLVPAYTTGATRTAGNTWREYGAGIVDILYRHYAFGKDDFTKEDRDIVQGFAMGIQEAVEYVVDAMYQVTIGLAAADFTNESEFEAFRDRVNDPANYGKVSDLMPDYDESKEHYDKLYALPEAEQMLWDAREAVSNSLALADECNWTDIEYVLSDLMISANTYLGNKPLSDDGVFESITRDNVILFSPDSGLPGRLASYIGNFSAFATWRDDISLEAMTAFREETGILLRMQAALESVKAAAGGWTRANLDDRYGFAIDLAFRCNEPSLLQLQTRAQMRVEDDSEYPVTQGSGSFMQFQSDNMDTDQLIALMDTIRVGFVSDRGELLAVAKLDLSKSNEYEGAIDAPLFLYEYTLEEGGQITVNRRSEDAVIRDLPRNSPVIVTVVVWMDGDSVDNSMVSELAHQSMYGILNLQFSGSADLIPSGQMID